MVSYDSGPPINILCKNIASHIASSLTIFMVMNKTTWSFLQLQCIMII